MLKNAIKFSKMAQKHKPVVETPPSKQTKYKEGTSIILYFMQ